jgi:hypothetical protein
VSVQDNGEAGGGCGGGVHFGSFGWLLSLMS